MASYSHICLLFVALFSHILGIWRRKGIDKVLIVCYNIYRT